MDARRTLIAFVLGFSLSAVALAEDPAPVVPQNNIPPLGGGGFIQIQGGPAQAGNITIVGGGVIILNGITFTSEPPAVEAREMPIVSDGFASDVAVKGSIAPLCKALRSDDFIERENASQSLLRLPPECLTDVVAALATETDAEAIARLKAAAGHLFLKPRTPLQAGTGFLGVGALGAATSVLGVKYDSPTPVHVPGEEAPVLGVKVAEINPGFPSLQDLRVGDIIIAIAGKPLPIDQASSDEGEDVGFKLRTEFHDRIISLWPGSVTAFTVLRGGKVRELPVQTAAVSTSDAQTLDTWVRQRNALMEHFVDGLKTGVQSSAAAVTVAPPPMNETTHNHLIKLTVEGIEIEGAVPLPDEPAPRRLLLPVLHRLSDAVVSIAEARVRSEGDSVSCTKGCDACCRQMVPIAPTEAFGIAAIIEQLDEADATQINLRFAEALAKLGGAGVLDRLRNPSQLSQAALAQLDRDYFAAGVPCPFLAEGACFIHSQRPLACREYLVSSPAIQCNDPGGGGVRRLELGGRMSLALQREEASEWLPLVLAQEFAAKGQESQEELPELLRRILSLL